MIWFYYFAGLLGIAVLTWAANSAHKRRKGRRELIERRVKFNNEHGGPLQRVFRRWRNRRRK